MDGRGGCCIARHASGYGAYHDMSKEDRILLRFRPIAPKPAPTGAVTGGSKIETAVKNGRGKRRYVRCNNNNNNNNSRCSSKRKHKWSPEEEAASGGSTVVTLPLLPDTPAVQESPARGSSTETVDASLRGKNMPIWLSFDSKDTWIPPLKAAAAATAVESWVRVESVMDTWVDGYLLGYTDEERVMKLASDTCPGFVSDGSGRVRWMNRAYREAEGEGDDVVVRLDIKDGVRLPVTCRAFTCRVKVAAEKRRRTQILPCDVWRMDGGGFAWRLDTKVALSLGW